MADRNHRLPLGFFLRNRLEVVVHLFPVLRWRLVVGARRETLLRFLRLKLLGERRLCILQRRGRLTPEVLPFRKVLLERLGARRRRRQPLPLEREPRAAATEARVLTPQLFHQLARLLHGPLHLLSKARGVKAPVSRAGALALPRAARLARHPQSA